MKEDKKYKFYFIFFMRFWIMHVYKKLIVKIFLLLFFLLYDFQEILVCKEIYTLFWGFIYLNLEISWKSCCWEEQH